MKNLMFYLKFAIVLVVIGWIAKAWAVPNDVKAEVTQYPIVHQGGCQWREMKVPCQIFYNEKDEIVYLVIYTLDLKDITHVVKVTSDKVEHVLYINPKYQA